MDCTIGYRGPLGGGGEEGGGGNSALNLKGCVSMKVMDMDMVFVLLDPVHLICVFSNPSLRCMYPISHWREMDSYSQC